jgi:hypothetical protein
MDLPSIPFSELLQSLISLAPPWVGFSVLIGLIGASAFYIVFGRGFRSLPTYLALGVLVAPLCQAIGAGPPRWPPPLTVGEVDLVVVGAGTWGMLAIARLLRL